MTPKICSFNVVIKGISCGLAHTVFVSESGHVYSMGSNAFGQLGQDKSVKAKNTPSLVEGLVDQFVVSVACGNQHSVAVTDTGLVYTWGYGKTGALGTGRSDNQYEPVMLSGLEGVNEVSAGANHSALLTKDGVLYVCGQGSKGQLGIGECDNVFSVVRVRDNVRKVACGESHTLILV